MRNVSVSHALLGLVDITLLLNVTRAQTLSKHGCSPFEGTRFLSTVAATGIDVHIVCNADTIGDSRLGHDREYSR